MSKLHLPIPAADMAASTAFYWAVFGAAPTVMADEVAWFELTDPDVHLLINKRQGAEAGTHRILWIASQGFVAKARARLEDAGLITDDVGAIGCHYRNDWTLWLRDPDGNRLNVYTKPGAISAGETTRTFVCVNDRGYLFLDDGQGGHP